VHITRCRKTTLGGCTTKCNCRLKILTWGQKSPSRTNQKQRGERKMFTEIKRKNEKQSIENNQTVRAQFVASHLTKLFRATLLCIALCLSLTKIAYAAPGDLDTTFGSGGKVVTKLPDENTARQVEVQPDGKIVAFGWQRNVSGNLLGTYLIRYNSNGAIDDSFGTNGIVTVNCQTECFEDGFVILPDGKILIAGEASVSNVFNFAAFRLNANGSRDATWGTNGVVTIPVVNGSNFGHEIVVQPDGKIIILGAAQRGTSNNYDIGIAQLNPNGSIDNSFGTNGVAVVVIPNSSGFCRITEVRLQPDGKFMFLYDSYGAGIDGVGRINADGTLDTTFAAGGLLTVDNPFLWNVQGLALQSDGKFILATRKVSGGSALESTVSRYNPNGTPDVSFGANGQVVFAPQSTGDFLNLRAVLIQPNGKILVGGGKNTASMPRQFLMLRLNPNGSVDTSFGTNGFVATMMGGTDNDVITNLVWQPDGKFVAFGFVFSGGLAKLGLARYLSGDVGVQRAAPRDFYGTGRSNFYQSTVSGGLRYFSILKNPVTSPEERRIVQWGLPADRPMNGDFDGDLKTDIAVWREGVSVGAQNYYYIQPSGGASQFVAIPWGKRGDIEGFGYFDDDAKSDVMAIRRENGQLIWYIQLSSGGSRAIPFGFDTDLVFSLGYGFQDFSGDGIADLVVRRVDPDNGNVTFYVGDGRNGNLILVQQWGNVSGESPVGFNFADFAGDGRADIVAYYGACPLNCDIGGTWWIKETGNSNSQVVRFGIPFNNQTGAGDELISQADYDGDGKFDITVFRRSNNTFYVRRSSDGGLIEQPFNFFPR